MPRSAFHFVNCPPDSWFYSVKLHSFTVRQYRILQSDLRSGQSLRNVPRTFLRSLPLHCCRHPQPACDLLILRATHPGIRDFHPLKKNTCNKHCLTKIICIFGIFHLLCNRCALPMQGAHTRIMSHPIGCALRAWRWFNP